MPSVLEPAGSEADGTVIEKPDAAQYGLPRAVATSGRFPPTTPLPSMVPPLPIWPRNNWTSSAPAQPWAVVSTNQPLTLIAPLVDRVAPVDGLSMKPVNVLLALAASGPGAQPELGAAVCAAADPVPRTSTAANALTTGMRR